MITESDRDALAEEMFDAWQGPGSWPDTNDHWRDEFRGRADVILDGAWLAGHDKRVAAKIREYGAGYYTHTQAEGFEIAARVAEGSLCGRTL